MLTYADRFRRLPPPDLSSEGTAFCDTTAAAALGDEADQAFAAADALLREIAPVTLPDEARRRAHALAAAVHRARGAA